MSLWKNSLFSKKIESGLNDIKNGRTVSHEKVKKEVKKWLK